jgi:cell division septation protein DedD
MKNQETGEFELLVGNGQIISGFFIMALLLAVFFAMGFIVARAKYQQEPAAASTIASNLPAETRGPAAAPANPPASPPDDASKRPADTDASKRPVDSEAKPLTQPTQNAKPEVAAEPPPAQPVPAEAVQGTYWQVSATGNQDAARALQETIKDMGLPVTLSQGPNKLTHVLVGPYSDKDTMAKVKMQLENAGLSPVKHTQ